jgi:hypothetical protein
MGASRANWLVLLVQFYANSDAVLPECPEALLLLQIDALVLVAGDGGANLSRSLAQLWSAA